MSVTKLEREYREKQPQGHYFDRSTLLWFGSCERRAIRQSPGWLYTERQGNTPEGEPAYRAVLFDGDMEVVADEVGATRAEAIRAAYDDWTNRLPRSV